MSTTGRATPAGAPSGPDALRTRVRAALGPGCGLLPLEAPDLHAEVRQTEHFSSVGSRPTVARSTKQRVSLEKLERTSAGRTSTILLRPLFANFPTSAHTPAGSTRWRHRPAPGSPSTPPPLSQVTTHGSWASGTMHFGLLKRCYKHSGTCLLVNLCTQFCWAFNQEWSCCILWS